MMKRWSLLHRWRGCFALLALAVVCLQPPLAKAASAAASVPAVVAAMVPEAAAVGSGTYSYVFWDLYTATLYAPAGQWRAEAPFALELRYLTDLKGRKIASVSRDEIARQGRFDDARLAAWEARMAEVFPDVQPGSVLTGVRLADGTTRFYVGERELGQITDPAFAQAFFDIWLGQATRDRELRSQLLGQVEGNRR
jgi:hypothetical protein